MQLWYWHIFLIPLFHCKIVILRLLPYTLVPLYNSDTVNSAVYPCSTVHFWYCQFCLILVFHCKIVILRLLPYNIVPLYDSDYIQSSMDNAGCFLVLLQHVSHFCLVPQFHCTIVILFNQVCSPPSMGRAGCFLALLQQVSHFCITQFHCTILIQLLWP